MVKACFHRKVPKRRAGRPDRYTAGQLDTDLRRVIRAVVADDESLAAYYAAMGYLELGFDPGPGDRRLRELEAVQSIRIALDLLANQMIVAARRSEPVLTWREIGAALGMTGQAAGQHAHKHQLPVDLVEPDDYIRLGDEIRAARGLPPLPPNRRDVSDLGKYDHLLHRPHRSRNPR